MADEVLRMQNITKIYPNGFVANKDITFGVGVNEIHALVGENGAGKTTLMKILFGMEPAQEGKIFINGKEEKITNPLDAIAKGVGMVHQHFMLVPSLTVAENIVLGPEPKKYATLIDMAKAVRDTQEICEKYNLKVDPTARVRDLPVGMKQKVEILKALYRNAQVLILDEPTAVLTPQEVDELFKILRQLKKDGKTIVFITHKLNETMALSDRITVLRKGKVVCRCNTSETNEKELAAKMVGRSVETVMTKKGQIRGDVVMELKNVRLLKKAQETVSLTVHAGEILGIAGVDGNGQQELEALIIGNKKMKEGSLLINGTEARKMSVKERKKLGIGYIPSDRHKNAMIADFSIAENFLLGYQDKPQYNNHGFINYANLRKDAQEQADRFETKLAGLDQPIGQLSGGNQQKIILGRETSHDPSFMLVAQPVRGLDIGAIEKVHRTLLELKEQGKAILLISAELSDIMNLSDRIAVLYEGRVSALFENGEYTKEEIGLFMTGKSAGGKNS